MARDETFKNVDGEVKSYASQMLDEGVRSEDLGALRRNAEDTNPSISSLPIVKNVEISKPQDIPIKNKSSEDNFTPPSLIPESKETIHRTFVIDKELSDALDNMTINQRTQKKLKGSRGLIKKIVNNALRQELVKLQQLNEKVLDDLESYK